MGLPGVQGEVKASTAGSYRYAVQALDALVGSIPLQSLSFTAIKAAYQTLAEGWPGRRPLAGKTVHNYHAALRHALGDAVLGHLIQYNPAERAHRLPTDEREMAYWNARELSHFLIATKAHPMFAIYRLAASTGMRRGELLGLRWRDVDLRAARLSVVQQYSRQGPKLTFSSVKTKAGKRSISLDATTVQVLRQHREDQTPVVAQFGGSLAGPRPLFLPPGRHTLRPDVVSQAF